MEDLYGNLDNYNEVNALEELRSENEELKVKLEEYATAMEKLQKEFDTVSSEYKKLEHNYSSLLKTAKAEIERKTQIITNMNIEKDMMVLSALQNGNRNILKARQCMPNTMRNFKKNNNGAQKNHMKNAKGHEKQNNKNDTGKERLQNHHMSSEDIMSKENTQEISTGHKPASNTDASVNILSSATDNPKNENNSKSGQIAPVNVKHRRKSNVGHEKLSSDEMGDGLTGSSKHDQHTRHKEDRKSFTKNHNDKYIGKGPETSSMDDKYSSHLESSRETLKARQGKYYNGDKHRSRERNDNSQRYKRYHSPERYNKKPRDYDEYEYNQRAEFSRSRGRESPSNDRFHHNSYKEHRQYEKYHTNEQERYIHNQDKYVGKHKTLYEYDEPNRKRQRTECYGRLKEDGKWHDREIFKVQELTETFEQLEEQYTSCQSPDYISCETAPEPIKVIRNTAETQLEDPRLVTNKYILSNEKGLVTLSTLNSKHVNIIPVDKKKWGLQIISMPDALMQLPREDQLIKDLYTDIDIDQRNMLTEKNEVENVTSEHITKDMPDNSNNTEDTTNRTTATPNVAEKVDKPSPGSLSSYKIPKIKRNVKENKNDLKERSMEKIENLYIAHDKDLKYRLTRNRSKSPSNKYDNNNVGNESAINVVSQNDVNLQTSERVFSTREIVEGDLELSDETCDNTELQKTIIQNASEQDSNCYHKTNLLHTEVKDIPNHPSIHDNQSNKTDKYSDCITMTNFQNQKVHAPEEIITQHEKTGEHVEVHKKHKSKKKTHKHRDSDHLDSFDKKLKAKKDKKEKPKEAKTKFNDLFGDSSSLITPDDLGIPVTNVPAPSQLTLNYVPIFEDAIDATDLEQNTNIKAPIELETKDNVNAPALVPVSVGNNGKVNVIESISKINEICKDSLNLKSHNSQTSEDPACRMNTAEELNLENCNKQGDIVATIIISTGIQPDEIHSESRAESLVNAEELLSDNIDQDQNFEFQNDHNYETNKHQDLLINALATSTPHKQVVNQITLEIDSKVTEPARDSNSRIENISNSNKAIQPPNEDVPDVRIFVKRRRRLVKPAK